MDLKRGFRMPTTDEVFMGLGLALGLNLMVINPIMKERWNEDWQMPIVLIISMIMGVFSAMKLRDGQRWNATEKSAKVEMSGPWARVHCTRVECRGDIIVKPVSEVDICFMCPVCRQELRVGRSSGDEVKAYAPIDGCDRKV